MRIFVNRLVEVAKKKAVVAGGVALVAFAAGTGSGYLYAKKKLIVEYDEKMELEIERTRSFLEKKYKRQNKLEEFSTPEKAAEALITNDAEQIQEQINDAAEALENYKGSDEEPEDVRTVKHPLAGPPRQMNRNIFTEPQPQEGVDFNYNDEIAARSSDVPYIISAEEFENGEFDSAELTWYEGDETLADSVDTVIPEYEYEKYIGGVENLRFGHRSDQNHIVYIRAEAMEMDFEVAKHGGKYSVAVAGFPDDDRPTQEPIRRPAVGRVPRGDI